MKLHILNIKSGLTLRSQKPPNSKGEKARTWQAKPANSGPMRTKKRKIPLPIQCKAGVLIRRTPFVISPRHSGRDELVAQFGCYLPTVHRGTAILRV